MGMLDIFKVSNGIANNINFSSDILGTGTYSGHVNSSRKPDGRGVFINSLEIEYDGEWQNGRLCGFGRKYAKGYYDMVQGKDSEEDDDASKSLVYAGDFKDNRFHGKGKQYRQTGKIEYDGDWVDGWRCGEGIEYYENGRIKFEGSWDRSRYNGKGVYTCENGDVIEGEWNDGLLEGEAKVSTRDNCVYKRSYHEGKVLSEELISGTPKISPDAQRTLKFDNGTYVGEVDFNGKIHGKGVFTYTNGNKYEGSFKEGLKHGKGVFTWADGNVYDGEYEDDMRSGVGVYSYINGNKYDGEWKDNVKNGRGVFYYKNGDRYDGSYSESLRQGRGVYYYKNGSILDCEWNRDMRHGKGVFTYPDGRRSMQTWENDRLIKEEPFEKSSSSLDKAAR